MHQSSVGKDIDLWSSESLIHLDVPDELNLGIKTLFELITMLLAHELKYYGREAGGKYDA